MLKLGGECNKAIIISTTLFKKSTRRAAPRRWPFSDMLNRVCRGATEAMRWASVD